MTTLITVIHVFTCILLVLVVLVQQGKGAEISASFGGSSQTVFGSSGGANFFTRFTQGAAVVFMATSVILTIMGGQSKKSLFEGTMAPPVQQSATQTAPTGGTAPPANNAPAADKGATSPMSNTAQAPTSAKPAAAPEATGAASAPAPGSAKPTESGAQH